MPLELAAMQRRAAGKKRVYFAFRWKHRHRVIAVRSAVAVT